MIRRRFLGVWLSHVGVVLAAGVCLLCPSAAAAAAWSAPVSVDSPFRTGGVSCPTTTFCLAVGSDGRAATFDGHSWGTPAAADSATNPLGTIGLEAVSCVSASFCMAVDSEGNAVSYDGSSWTAPTAIDSPSNGGLQSVSCPSANFCVAADYYGYAVI